MRVEAVRTVLPEHRYEQHQITEALAAWTGADLSLLRRFHKAAQVKARHLALPIDEYPKLVDFSVANDLYIDTAVRLGEQALRDVLEASGIRPEQVDLLVFCSSTGVATPSLDATLAQRVGLREDVKRLPVFGLGCAAGAAGLSRISDYLRAWPDQVAALVCVEVCSLTAKRDDHSLAHAAASSLFGDGAASVVAVGDRFDGDERPSGTRGPRVVATRSRLYPDTKRLMGWDVGQHGFRIVLAPDLVDHIGATLADDVTGFLGDHGLSAGELSSWVCHPGGPKVIDKICEVLGLHDGELDMTWDSLREVGNLSSVSVLNVLQETIERRHPAEGEPGLLLAMGPGFAAELLLLRW